MEEGRCQAAHNATPAATRAASVGSINAEPCSCNANAELGEDAAPGVLSVAFASSHCGEVRSVFDKQLVFVLALSANATLDASLPLSLTMISITSPGQRSAVHTMDVVVRLAKTSSGIVSSGLMSEVIVTV